MAKINFGGVLENVATRKEFPLKKLEKFLKMKQLPSSVMEFKVQPKP